MVKTNKELLEEILENQNLLSISLNTIGIQCGRIISKIELPEMLGHIEDIQQDVHEEELQDVVDEIHDDAEVKLYVEYRKETEKAVLFERSDGLVVWVPKSQMRDSWEEGDHLPLKEVPSWCTWKEDNYGG